MLGTTNSFLEGAEIAGSLYDWGRLQEFAWPVLASHVEVGNFAEIKNTFVVKPVNSSCQQHWRQWKIGKQVILAPVPSLAIMMALINTALLSVTKLLLIKHRNESRCYHWAKGAMMAQVQLSPKTPPAHQLTASSRATMHRGRMAAKK